MPSPLQYRSIQALQNEKPNQTFLLRVLVKSIDEKISKNNQPYLSVAFSDKTGQFIFNCFHEHPIYPLLQKMKSGGALEAHASNDTFNSQFSPRIQYAQEISTEDPTVLAALIEIPKEPIADLWTELLKTINTDISNPALKLFLNYLVTSIREPLCSHPAGRSMHHAYKGGLLEHTVHMLRVAKRIIDIYPSVRKDIALAGIIVHDLGKIREYNFGLVAERNKEGNFLGHIILGLQILDEAVRVTPLPNDIYLDLKHIIASHMQKLDWGAASLPATPEAVFVSMVDNLDAKMAMTEKSFEQTLPGSFGTFHKGLSTCLWRESTSE